ncbi:hypothetical protein [Amorphus orientalis]|uniref:Glycosyltransferase n=1 Tax=Amorphus orientalis TaxID=649198 RepID=A0AAE4AUL8_9HYPH|nr:hypothetical protein [Amorphus orientalis]MDQ0317550.1 hypothetical protein [Amorphus orientalis]
MRILTDVSAHGFGHAMQTGCVMAALAARLPSLHVKLRTVLPTHRAREFMAFDDLGAAPLDPAPVMSAPDIVDVAATAEQFRAFPERFARAVAESRSEIDRFRPDLVFANIAAPGLVAAREKGVPAVALCSLNWADILRAVVPAGTVDDAALSLLDDAYGGADAFLMPAPSMEMSPWANRVPIGPIGRIGAPMPDAVRRSLGFRDDRPLGLVSWGGWTGSVAAGFLAALPDEIAWITDPGPVLAAGITYVDLLASCAIVIAKPGYGTFVEAAANRVRLVHTDRPGWPETPVLAAWAARNGAAREIHKETATREAAKAIADLMAETPPPPPTLTGADEAAALICERVLPAGVAAG